MKKIIWFCPKCGRQDPRHHLTKPDELPVWHTRPESMGNMWTNNVCDGMRIAQSWSEELRKWVS